MLVSTGRPAPDWPVIFAARFTEAAMHTPTNVTVRALTVLQAAQADAVVSFGGGAATGLGKALALRTGLPLIAVGTTYGGSEMTALLGETENGVKRTLRDDRVLPRVTIYDVDLTLGLPPHVSAASGINAIAHAVEATYSQEANPLVTAVALDAIAALHQALPLVVANPGDVGARSTALRGACEAGYCLNSVPMGLHHKLCHTLGGAFDLPHAETHAVILPHAMAYNGPAVADAFAKIGGAIGEDAISGIYRLASRIAPVRALRDLGMPETGIGRAVDLALANPYWNPRPIERDGIEVLIRRAWAGEAPV